MTTKDFIKKTYNTTSTKRRQCSSVFTDNQGNVYSFGYHYPLAFHIKGLDFVNTTGYSNSTARHIAWAHSALDYTAVSVKLWRIDTDELFMFTGQRVEDDRALEIIKRALERELHTIRAVMDNKKRKDTSVYRNLENREARVIQAILKVEEAMA